jgi:hypothetical protein
VARPKSPFAKSAARRQAEYKARKKGRGLVRQSAWVDPAKAATPEATGTGKIAAGEQKTLLLDEELKVARQAGRQKEREKHARLASRDDKRVRFLCPQGTARHSAGNGKGILYIPQGMCRAWL